MVRIIKTMQPKHFETLSPWLKEFRDSACAVSLPLLPQHLASFPSRWPFPRGDLYHWISLLNRFDVILGFFCETYNLENGPQTLDFDCTLLQGNIERLEASDEAAEKRNLQELGYSSDGDRELIESILGFTRMLLQNCGNRSLYASSSHLNSLLNTTSLSLLESTLVLGIELAQRYQAAVKRMNVNSKHHASMLQNHYNIDLQKVNQLALPFSKKVTAQSETIAPNTPATPTVKGKERATFNSPSVQKATTMTVYATDLVSLVKGGSGTGSSQEETRNGISGSAPSEANWDEWGDIKLTYYPKPAADTEMTATPGPPRNATSSPAAPVTPTPVRRSSNLGPHGQRPSRIASSDETPRPSPLANQETQQPSFKTIEISSADLKSDGVHNCLKENITGLASEFQYELLTKLRVANALTSSLETRQQLLAIRLLAITNLAYIYPEGNFIEHVMKQDSDEPRRLQLAYQLAELVHPPADGDVPVPQHLQTVAFCALDALSQHQTKYSDVCAALNTNVNHGVLLYVIRKAVAGMDVTDEGDKVTEEDEWRDALFSLISDISVMPRTGADLVTAGLIPILVEILQLRTPVAERYQPKVLSFLDTIMYSARDAFQNLVAADGLDAVSMLITHQVTTASAKASTGEGMPSNQRSTTVDYEIPYFHQQSLKWLFKFIHHMMTTAGGYGGNFDRLLRNLIDSSTLLKSLREVIENAHRFGSVVWTNAVSILNDFINNEPTSFAVIAEAGLSRGLLEAVTGKPIIMPSPAKKEEKDAGTELERAEGDNPDEPAPSSPHSDEDDSDDEYGQPPARPTLAELETPRAGPLAEGIMPTADTISIVPQAFGAICLNNAGMKMFQASGALESFFEIFESPEHIKCMNDNDGLPMNLGTTFDELMRHHPPLKPAIMNAVLNMVTRVSALCKVDPVKYELGTKIWTTDSAGRLIPAEKGTTEHQVQISEKDKGKGKASEDTGDVEMADADPAANTTTSSKSENRRATGQSMTPFVEATAGFLSGIFSTPSVRSDFSAQGGIEFVLDMADSPCLDLDFDSGARGRHLQHVIALLAEQKPHLTIPSLLRRAQSAADVLAPFASHVGPDPFFKALIDKDVHKSADPEFILKGTEFAKALLYIHSIVPTLHACFQPSAYTHRNTNTSFNQLNFGDYYVKLVESLGTLLGASFREESAMEKIIPESFKHPTSPHDPIPVPSRSQQTDPVPVLTDTEHEEKEEQSRQSGDKPGTSTHKKSIEKKTAEYYNYQTLRHLLKKMPHTVSPFFQTLGKNLITKRNSTDNFQKQSHAAIADALAIVLLGELNPDRDHYHFEAATHWMGILDVLKNVLIDVSRHSERPVQTITLVLQSFKEHDGFKILNKILTDFAQVIETTTVPPRTGFFDKPSTESKNVDLAVNGMRIILSLYSQIVSGKNVTEAVQTISMASREGRERTRPEFFSPSQFVVELRFAILPTIRSLWESELVEKAPSDISEKLIEVIKITATADAESGALKRPDKPWPVVKPVRKTFKINSEHTIVEQEYGRDLGSEALFRCNNHATYALEYCKAIQQDGRPRYPVPEGDMTPIETVTPSRPDTGSSTGTTHSNESAVNTANLQTSRGLLPPPTPDTSSAFELIINQLNRNEGDAAGSPGLDLLFQSPAPTSSATPAKVETPAKEDAVPAQVTVDDLNDERAAIRENLIDKCLDVINAHGEVTFEVADLISTVVNKSPDPSAQRKVVGETLVIALMSFAGEEDLDKSGKKIAAYAHLLALMLRDKHFYKAAVGELKENLSTLLGFVKLSPNHSAEEPSPWIAQILLIVEMLLSEDARPRKMVWSPPRSDEDAIQAPVLEPFEPAVPEEEQAQLLEAILDILPRIGKDEGLALSVLRILVILTRTRAVAQNMGEKKNIQRLFVMAKQLAGASTSRIQGPLMLILRHIIEDDETIKQIMRSEIKSHFELAKSQRSAADPVTYIRSLAHISIRAPQLFVDMTNEMVKYMRWSYSNSDPPGRPNSLGLKDTSVPQLPKLSEDTVQPTVQATEDLTLQDIKPSTEDVDTEMKDVTKAPATEHKLPVVENPDGVIHFLLCELLNYKDVEDKDPASAINSLSPTAEKPTATATTNGDIAMADSSSDATPAVPPKDGKSTKAKVEFKAEDNPIYIYRCFLLQCLTELLGSYNRTKIEFINFKRSAPPQSMTPSKPRSSVVNYLLSDLIPIGTLDTTLTTSLQKKITTSSWANSVITALLAKTGEQFLDKTRDESDGEDEPDLFFVRKFVLENILKAYKEASTSSEPLDAKYARMFSLAELMEHIMNEKEKASESPVSQRSHYQLRRLMFEKGFIASLTASIADVDLNFPSAKRAVKQILKPLKVLTNTAVHLSDLSLISASPNAGEEEEIESATSVSEGEEEREETPDLFRNSTLGMFEPGREEDSSSESEDDDEEMYEDGYGDEMEYDEDPEDDEDNISEDEDIEGMGPIEGLDGDHNLEVEVVMDEDDDDDDDEDDEEESSSSDDDSEDDDGRVEIIDEAGNIQEIVEEEGMEDWEDEDGDDDDDEDGEEVDYEGEAQDDEEAQIHDMDAMMGDGPLGDLVRALGHGNAGHLDLELADRLNDDMRRDEMLERADLEDGDEERMASDYMEDEEDDEEDVDEMMEEEEMFLGGNYPGPEGGAIFGWEGEEPPMVVQRGHRHRHAFPSPFPFLPGARDPLGGMSNSHFSPLAVDEPRQPEQRWLPFGEPRAYLPPERLDSIVDAFLDGEEGQDAAGRPVPYEPDGLMRNIQRDMDLFRFGSRRPDLPPPLDTAANNVSDTVPGEFRYRSHRPGQVPGARSTDDGTNPLLQRTGSGRAGRDSTSRIPTSGSWIQAMAPPGAAELLDLTRGGPFGESPATAALLEMLRSLPNMPGAISRNGAALQFHITTGPGHEVPSELRALFGIRGSRHESRRDTTEPSSAAFFAPQSTTARWTEEAKILFGPDYVTVSMGIKTAMDSVLVPPAVEAEKIKKEAEAARIRKLEEEAKKRQEEERIAREAKEAEEKIEREKKEAEEAETAARLAAEALAERGQDPEAMEDESTNPVPDSDLMEGVEGAAPSAPDAADAEPAADRPRVTTVIRGNTMDITDLGIDPEFLAELPEELREEVIMSAVAERRSQAVATGAQPSEIDQEFLDALPEDIRDEIIQSERQERRRREREEQRRASAAANGGAAVVGEMDAASILATLPAALRQQVLMEQDEDMLNLLPPDIAEQARAAQREHPAHPGRVSLGHARRIAPVDVVNAPPGSQRPARRTMVQMLDKSGIATLLRLMFTFQVNNLRSALNAVLENVCLNRHNRTEVLGTLLSILQDGSIDMSAVERSFQQLSIRAKQPKEKELKTPQQPLKRTFTGMSSSISLTHSVSDGATPLLVVQQCLAALNNLTTRNPHVPAYFLTEHDVAGGLKRSLSRKGKGKENKAGKYAINSLLSLLDRDLIMESSSIMEALSTLLSQITAPLQALQRKQKEYEEAAKKAAAVGEVTETTAAEQANQQAPPADTQTVTATATEITTEDSEAPVPEAPATVDEGSAPEASKPADAAKEAEKKPRQISPPVIPEQNLKLVINIFIARECSSRTFRETLSTIKNLSAIPGAKAVFGRELITKAQGLGEIILKDLEDLLPQIQKATTGTEIQGVALAKFSPGGSDQNKLLRVLTALDHLFDPKRDKKDQPSEAETEGESSQLVEKQDLLSSLYENSTFGPMWEKLSACLSAIRQREHMLNVATILLPLIEALMVVCKNTTLKETSSRQNKEMLLTSPPPESRMESLFFTFTEEHRKILNDLVRHTPKLMSGTFSLLVKNPKVLEFDNKRNYFSRSIHSKAPNSRQAFPALQLSVRRDQIFHDSFKSLYFQTGDQMKYGKLSIRFHGEEGVDAGGVTREWFQVLSRQMFDPGYALFIPVSSDRTTFHPNQLSSINDEHLMFFKFIGRIIGKALYEGRVLDCHFSRAVYKRILGKSVSVKDMESLDPDYYKSLIWMLENDITDIITETFSVDNDKFGVVETIDFIPNGRNVAVTQENKHEYVRLMVEWKLTGSVKEQLDEFLKGFHEIIPAELVAIFNEQELELLISGLPEIDVDDWKGNTEYHNYTASSPQIQWFWRAIRSYDKEERAKLLQFVTGTSKVPLNGFKELEGMNGFSRFNIHRDYGNKERLPSSHTCFNQLDLPEYESYESLRSHILTAITAGSEYFGFA